MSPVSLVVLPMAMLVAGVLLQCLLAGVLTARAKGWLAFASGLGSFAAIVSIWPKILAGKVIDVALAHWDGPAQFAFHVDGLSFLFAAMGAGIGTAVLFYAVAYMEEEKGTTRFYLLVLIFITGLMNLVYTADLFLLYASWELVGLCSFLLVGFWYTNPDSAYGARKVFTITHLAGYGLLAAVVLLLCEDWFHALDRSARPRRVHLRDFRPGPDLGHREIGAVPAAFVDPVRDVCAHAGQRAAACRGLREMRRVSHGAAALVRPMAGVLGLSSRVGWNCDPARRRAVRPGAAGSEAPAGIQYGESDRIHDAGARTRHTLGDRRRSSALPQSRSVQGKSLHVRRRGTACHRNP